MSVGCQRWLLVGVSAIAAGCQRPRVADPRAAMLAYARAASAADADGIYRLLSERARRDLGREGTRRLVLDSKRELAEEAKYLSSADVHPEARALVRYRDGEQADLALEGGVFRVGSAAALPSAARTPVEALSDLRQALAARSYAALVRVLSADTRSAFESDIGAIVKGLEDPETLDVSVQGDDAQVEIQGGHMVKLKREAGVWRIEDVR